jgi:hypothetical protein
MIRLAWLGLVALVATAAAAEDQTRGASDVIACMRANTPEATLVQTVELITADRAGSERARSGKLYLKRFDDGMGRALLRVEAPPDLRGTAFLAIQNDGPPDMFLYLPEFKKVRRITSHSLRGRLLGTDFTYEELEHLFTFAKSTDLRLIEGGDVGGRAVHVLEATPDPTIESTYTRIVSHVDQETCVPLRIDFYEVEEVPRKQLSCDPDHITEESGSFVPRLVRMQDAQRGTESRLVTHSVEIDPSVPNRMFTQGQLAKGRR